MPAKDRFHDAVKTALVRDGWQITHDPFTISFGRRDVYVDLGAEQPIAAEKDGRRIAVEIKSFLGPSDVRDLEMAIGQYVFYRSLLSRVDATRELILAVPESAFVGIMTEEIAKPVLLDAKVSIVVFDHEREVVLKWIKSTNFD